MLYIVSTVVCTLLLTSTGRDAHCAAQFLFKATRGLDIIVNLYDYLSEL